jgi:hypothetical protein
MAPVNTRTAAVIDPILSTYARGYRNTEMVSSMLFPRVTVPNRNMRVVKFGKEAFRMMNTRRAPGANKKRVQYGYASDPISLVQDALEGVVPIEHQEESMSVPGIDLAQGAITMVMDSINLGLEYETATMARTTGNYSVNNRLALAAGARWTQAGSTPEKDIQDANEVIRRGTGRRGNTLLLGATAFNALSRHQAIKDQFKYTGRDSITEDMLAAFFRLKKVVVGSAVYLPDTAADTALATDIWGDDAVLAYVPMAGDNFQVPSFGYTYELAGYPQVETPYFERPNDSWIYPMKVERRPFITGADAGFLFTNAGQG